MHINSYALRKSIWQKTSLRFFGAFWFVGFH